MKRILMIIVMLVVSAPTLIFATVTGDTLKHVYELDNSATTFPYTFKILEDDDMLVTLYNTTTNSGTVLTLDTDYTVVGAGQDSGTRNVVYSGASSYGSTYRLILQSNVEYTQPTDYVIGGSFNQETHESALDRLAIQIKQLKEIQNRTIKVDAAQTTSVEFPSGTAGYIYTDGTNLSLSTPTTTELDYNGSISFGADASKDTTPSIGDIYFATDTDTIYRCSTNNVWTPLNEIKLASGTSLTIEDSGNTEVFSVSEAGVTTLNSFTTSADDVHGASVSIGDDLSVADNATIANTLYVQNDLNVTDDVDVGDDLNVDGDLTVLGSYPGQFIFLDSQVSKVSRTSTVGWTDVDVSGNTTGGVGKVAILEVQVEVDPSSGATPGDVIVHFRENGSSNSDGQVKIAKSSIDGTGADITEMFVRVQAFVPMSSEVFEYKVTTVGSVSNFQVDVSIVGFVT